MVSKPTPGIVERHSRSCPSRHGGKCAKPCAPTFVAWVWSPRDGKKIYKTFPTPSAAKGWRRDALAALPKGQLAPPSKLTVEQAANEWITKAKAGEILKPDGTAYKPSVLRTYESDLRRYVLPELGHVRLSNLQRRDVQRLVDTLVGKGLSGSRVRGAVMPLRAICRRAIRSDQLTVNPTHDLELPATAGVRDRVADAVERETLLATLPEEDRALWATALYAGLRRGELRGLQVDDVDTDARVIHVRRGWDDVEGEIEPKSRKGARRVPMTSELRLALLEHLARTGRRGSDLVFGRGAAEPFTPSQARKRALGSWAAAAVGAFLTRKALPVELEPIGLHECRHTYVSLMHDAGFSLERIGDYVGHSSAYMTDRYRHLLDGHEQEAADILDAYLASKTGTQTGTHLITRPLEPASLSHN
jgi:integrase